jgi:hypothetical protein
MPLLAILKYEFRGLFSSWLVRLWFAGSAILTLLTLASGWEQLATAPLIASLLFPYLVFPWFLVVILLGISPVTGTRLDILSDGILSRPVTRHEYILAAWAARVGVVVGVYFLVMLPAVLLLSLAQRAASGDGATTYGVIASLGVVALVLTFIVSLSFFVGTLLRSPLLAAAMLIFVWFPINLVLHTFSLEELSPVSLSQSLPTLLRTPWRTPEEDSTAEVSDEDMEAVSAQAAQFLSILSGEPARARRPDPNFFERGDYEDFSLSRVVLGYGLPAMAALLLATLCFSWRDL